MGAFPETTMPRSKKPGANMTKNIAQDAYFKPKDKDGNPMPPLMVRDPKPKRGLLEFLDMRHSFGDNMSAKESYVQMCVDHAANPDSFDKLPWYELFVVCERGNINLYRPECMFTGYTMSDALASIPVEAIFETNIDRNLGYIEMHTAQQVYRFRANQAQESALWQKDITQSAAPGMESLDDFDDDYDDEEPSIWKLLNQPSGNNGGLTSAIAKPADKLEAAEDTLLLELFCSIGGFDAERKDKDFMDGSDLVSWAANRLNLVKDKAKLDELLATVTAESCEEAVKNGMVHDTDSEGRMTFDVFKRTMCDPNSEMRSIILSMLDTFVKIAKMMTLSPTTRRLHRCGLRVLRAKWATFSKSMRTTRRSSGDLSHLCASASIAEQLTKCSMIRYCQASAGTVSLLARVGLRSSDIPFGTLPPFSLLKDDEKNAGQACVVVE